MSDADIKMLFEGDDRGLLRSFLAINGAVKQVDQNLSEVGKSAKKVTSSAAETTSGFKSLLNESVKIAAGIGLWQGAIKASQMALAEYKNEMADVARKQKEAASLSDKIHQGQIGLLKPSEQRDIGALQEFMRKNAGAAGVGIEESMAMGSAVRANAPDLNWRQAAGVGISIAGAGWIKDKKQFADLVGNLQDTFSDSSQDDVLDLATYLLDKSGADATKAAGLEKLIAQSKEVGLNPAEMFAVGVNALGKGYDTKALSSIIDMTSRNIEPVKGAFGRSLTEKDKIGNQLAGMNSQQRWEWIKTNPAQAEKYFGAEVTKMLPVIKPEEISQTLGKLTNAQRYNAFSVVTDVYKEQPENSAAIFEQKANSLIEGLVSGDPWRAAAGKARQQMYLNFAATDMSVGNRTRILNKMDYFSGKDNQAFIDQSLIEAEYQRNYYAPGKVKKLVSGGYLGGNNQTIDVDNPNANPELYGYFKALTDSLVEMKKETEILVKKLEENSKKTEANTRATNGGGVVLPLN
ncbi:MAG TPA: hypothetical protein PKB02_10665 [Anaerohalosphaeraceae bacterium]|nr:hypothetical protein [Anaerohalosphaeraceae bacterium]